MGKQRSSFRALSDSELLTRTSIAARSEKAATLVLLEHLAEVDERRAYAILSYSSLFDYVTRGLGYSESQASERVNAVRLLRQNEGVREHLNSGALTLTAAAQIQRFVVAEKRHAQHLREQERALVIEACLNQSKREVEKILLGRASELARAKSRERVRALSPEFHELKLVASEEQIQVLNRARELFPDDSMASLMERALKLLISAREMQLGKRSQDADQATSPEEVPSGKGSGAAATRLSTPPAMQPSQSGARLPTPPAMQPSQSGTQPPATRTPKQLGSRYIPREFKRIIFSRSGGQCEFVSEISGERCRSRLRLQIDHIKPLALGGSTELGNLRHLCAIHNLQRVPRYG